ncbi:hypothetical protein D3C77_746950 [compost metagenome]
MRLMSCSANGPSSRLRRRMPLRSVSSSWVLLPASTRTGRSAQGRLEYSMRLSSCFSSIPARFCSERPLDSTFIAGLRPAKP